MKVHFNLSLGQEIFILARVLECWHFSAVRKFTQDSPLEQLLQPRVEMAPLTLFFTE